MGGHPESIVVKCLVVYRCSVSSLGNNWCIHLAVSQTTSKLLGIVPFLGLDPAGVVRPGHGRSIVHCRRNWFELDPSGENTHVLGWPCKMYKSIHCSHCRRNENTNDHNASTDNDSEQLSCFGEIPNIAPDNVAPSGIEAAEQAQLPLTSQSLLCLLVLTALPRLCNILCPAGMEMRFGSAHFSLATITVLRRRRSINKAVTRKPFHDDSSVEWWSISVSQ